MTTIPQASWHVNGNSNLGNWIKSFQNETGAPAEAFFAFCCAHQDVSCSFSFPHQIPRANETYTKGKETVEETLGMSKIKLQNDKDQGRKKTRN